MDKNCIDAQYKYSWFPPKLDVSEINNILKTLLPENTSGCEINFDILANDVTLKSVMILHGSEHELLKKNFHTFLGFTKTEYAIGSLQSDKTS